MTEAGGGAAPSRRGQGDERLQGAAAADCDPRAEPDDIGEDPADRGGDGVNDSPAVAAAGWVAADQVGGEAPDTELEAGRPAQAVGVADHQLEAASAEIEGQGRAGIDDHAGPYRAEDQPGLLAATDHPNLDSGFGFDPVDDRARVAGVPEGGRAAGDQLIDFE